MANLTENDVSVLRWSAHCNDEFGVGFLGPSVKKFGRLPECEAMIRDGYVTCNDDRDGDVRGYWVTPAGRKALSDFTRVCEQTGTIKQLRKE